MPDWKPLPSWALDGALPISAADVDRVRSLAGLRVLLAMHTMAGFGQKDPVVTCSTRDIMSWSGLSRSSVQKGVAELVANTVIRPAPFVPGETTPKTYAL